jgi:hypothetical protein
MRQVFEEWLITFHFDISFMVDCSILSSLECQPDPHHKGWILTTSVEFKQTSGLEIGVFHLLDALPARADRMSSTWVCDLSFPFSFSLRSLDIPALLKSWQKHYLIAAETGL